MLLPSCYILEEPCPLPEEQSFVLHLDFDTALPLYKVITIDDQTRVAEEDMDLRYIVSVYSAEEQGMTSGRNELHRFVFTKEDIAEPDHSVELQLEPAEYNFVVWSDYVSSTSDLYYDTSSFEAISLKGEEHVGSNDYRDAFCGTVTTEVSDAVTETTVNMHRPMAKFNVISTDLGEFIAAIETIRDKKAHSQGEETVKEVALSDFDIVFSYNGYMPDVFNTFSNKPSDSATGVSFRSKMTALENNEAELGFDYIFVNGAESVVNITVEVYDYDGDLVSRFKPIDVPLMRSHLTTIKANFLTSNDGGVNVDPDYDGDFNITIP